MPRGGHELQVLLGVLLCPAGVGERGSRSCTPVYCLFHPPSPALFPVSPSLFCLSPASLYLPLYIPTSFCFSLSCIPLFISSTCARFSFFCISLLLHRPLFAFHHVILLTFIIRHFSFFFLTFHFILNFSHNFFSSLLFSLFLCAIHLFLLNHLPFIFPSFFPSFVRCLFNSVFFIYSLFSFLLPFTACLLFFRNSSVSLIFIHLFFYSIVLLSNCFLPSVQFWSL